MSLICQVTGYDDMGHYMCRLNFQNNNKFLHNFDHIKEDIQNYFYSHLSSFVESGLEKVGQGYIRVNKVIVKPFSKEFRYDNVLVRAEFKFE